MLVALLALLLQGFVVQSHIHTSPLTLAAYEQSADASTRSDGAHVDAAHHQTACVICQALAASGRAALPEAPALVASLGVAYETAALAISQAPRALAHSWHSRAPPIAL